MWKVCHEYPMKSSMAFFSSTLLLEKCSKESENAIHSHDFGRGGSSFIQKFFHCQRVPLLSMHASRLKVLQQRYEGIVLLYYEGVKVNRAYGTQKNLYIHLL